MLGKTLVKAQKVLLPLMKSEKSIISYTKVD
jgi:hypothetical protein